MALDENDRCTRCGETVETHGYCEVDHRHVCWPNTCPATHTECEPPK